MTPILYRYTGRRDEANTVFKITMFNVTCCRMNVTRIRLLTNHLLFSSVFRKGLNLSRDSV